MPIQLNRTEPAQTSQHGTVELLYVETTHQNNNYT